jgi:kynureninase
MDRNDPLRSFRSKFLLPGTKEKPVIYFTGNSLGLQPKITRQFVIQELEDWASLGSQGHFGARNPWITYHRLAKKTLASLTGASPSEVVAMNQLTVNIHLMMVSFYRPTKQRYKIVAEAGAFPSDQYAFESQLKFHGLNPDDALVEIAPREGEYTLREEDILKTIEHHGNQVALVFLSGLQYYTGQVFNIKKITEAGHRIGALVGFDVAHAIGNIPLNLHKDEVDFAVWCSYKYLNGGPGALAGAFVHEKYGDDNSIPRFAGWWGHREDERFLMKKGFKPMPGVDGWQLSNVPILQGAALLASLKIIREAGIQAMRRKSIVLTAYLEFLLKQVDPAEEKFTIITPSHPKERGCQLSVFIKAHGKSVHSSLVKAGVVADWREPNVIRLAPAPLYNTFEEVFRFAEIFKKTLKKV